MRHSYIFDEFYWRNFFGDGEPAAVLFVIASILIAIAAFAALCSVVMYILRSMGLYKLAQNRGMDNPGLAWIPFVGIFRAGSVADDISGQQGSKTYFGHIILGGCILSWIFSGVSSSVAVSSVLSGFSRRSRGQFMYPSMLSNIFSPIISLAGLAVFIITIIALNKIYKCYNPVHSTLWTVLSVIFPFLQPIFLFVLRNRRPAPEGWNDGPNMHYPPYDRQNGSYHPPQSPEPPIYPPRDIHREQAGYQTPMPRNQYETPEYGNQNNDENP